MLNEENEDPESEEEDSSGWKVRKRRSGRHAILDEEEEELDQLLGTQEDNADGTFLALAVRDIYLSLVYRR